MTLSGSTEKTNQIVRNHSEEQQKAKSESESEKENESARDREEKVVMEGSRQER